jgi:hypothetical protein
MRMVGVLLVAVMWCVSLGCLGGEAEPSAPRGLTQEDVGIPREHAEKVLKVLESANEHNDRLERMEKELFAEDAN